MPATTISDAELNEDWTKSLFFDFWNSDGSQVSTFSEMWPWVHLPPRPEELAEIQRMVRSAAWIPAPQQLKDETAQFLKEYGNPVSPGTRMLQKLLQHPRSSIRKMARDELRRRGGGDANDS